MLKKFLVLWLALALLGGPALAETPAGEALPPEVAYFDDAVFVGDSVTNQLQRYRANLLEEGENIFGAARFLSAGAYSLYLASLGKVQKDKPSPMYRGRSVAVPDGLKAMEAGKVFIMLGMADEPGRDIDTDMYRYDKLVRLIREAVPGIHIVAVSITPITKRGEAANKLMSQEGIDRFNARLEALCGEIGIDYLDTASSLKDEFGYLPGGYSNDKKVHLSETGLRTVVEVLHQYAKRKLAGR